LRITWIVLILLVLAMLGLTVFWHGRQQAMNGVLVIRDDNRVLFHGDIAQTNFGTRTGDTFRGWLVLDVLRRVRVKDDWSRATFVAADGGTVTLEHDEIKWMRLARVEDDGETYYRLVLTNDEFKQRWLKNIRRIELQ